MTSGWVRIAASSFFWIVPAGRARLPALHYADCAVNVDPDPAALADMRWPGGTGAR